MVSVGLYHTVDWAHSKSHMTSTETQGIMAEFTLYFKTGFQKSVLMEQSASGKKGAGHNLTSYAESIKMPAPVGRLCSQLQQGHYRAFRHTLGFLTNKTEQ